MHINFSIILLPQHYFSNLINVPRSCPRWTGISACGICKYLMDLLFLAHSHWIQNGNLSPVVLSQANISWIS